LAALTSGARSPGTFPTLVFLCFTVVLINLPATLPQNS
jgi:hypothetical protein